MKLDKKMIADLCEGASDAAKRALGVLPALAAPKSTRTLEDAMAALAATQAAGGWYCLRVDTMRQGKIIDEFKKVGVESYYPLGKAWKMTRSHGRSRSIEKMLAAFPGYLFVGFSTAVDWMMVKETVGVLSVIGNSAGEPRRLSNAEIETIRAKEKRGEYNWDWRDPNERPKSKFGIVKKDRVEIVGTHLAQYTGVVKRTPKSRKAEIVPDLFPDQVVHIDIKHLRVIP